jgi:hypothetical protein
MDGWGGLLSNTKFTTLQCKGENHFSPSPQKVNAYFKNTLFQMATTKWYVCQILDEVSTNGVKMGFFNELAPK